MNTTYTKPASSESIPCFIRKTYQILEEGKFRDIVDWNEEGTALVIFKPIDFSAKVLPTYFKHRQLTSFIRQLNLYNFHKRRTINLNHVYFHELFQRGQSHLLHLIKRKSQDRSQTAINSVDCTAVASPASAESVPAYKTKVEGSPVFDEAQSLRIKMASMERQIKELRAQNRELSSRVTEQERNENITKNFVSKIAEEYRIPIFKIPSFLRYESEPRIVPKVNKMEVVQEKIEPGLEMRNDFRIQTNNDFSLTCPEDFGNPSHLGPFEGLRCTNELNSDALNWAKRLPSLGLEKKYSKPAEVISPSTQKHLFSQGLQIKFGSFSLQSGNVKNSSEGSNVSVPTTGNPFEINKPAVDMTISKRRSEKWFEDNDFLIGGNDSFFKRGISEVNFDDEFVTKVEAQNSKKVVNGRPTYFDTALELMISN